MQRVLIKVTRIGSIRVDLPRPGPRGIDPSHSSSLPLAHAPPGSLPLARIFTGLQSLPTRLIHLRRPVRICPASRPQRWPPPTTSPSPKLGIDRIALVCTGSSMIGATPELTRLSTTNMARGGSGNGVGGVNEFGCPLATRRFGIVEYENRNLRGSFQVRVLSFRKAHGVVASRFCVLSSSRLHSYSSWYLRFLPRSH